MKVTDYDVIDGSIIAIDYSSKNTKEIDIDHFTNWLSDNGHMESFHVSADHNGEPVEHEFKFADFEEWSLDKTNLDVIKYIQEYLNEQHLHEAKEFEL